MPGEAVTVLNPTGWVLQQALADGRSLLLPLTGVYAVCYAGQAQRLLVE